LDRKGQKNENLIALKMFCKVRSQEGPRSYCSRVVGMIKTKIVQNGKEERKTSEKATPSWQEWKERNEERDGEP